MNTIRTKSTYNVHGKEGQPAKDKSSDDNTQSFCSFGFHTEAFHLYRNITINTLKPCVLILRSLYLCFNISSSHSFHNFFAGPFVKSAGTWAACSFTGAVATTGPACRGTAIRAKPLNAQMIFASWSTQ